MDCEYRVYKQHSEETEFAEIGLSTKINYINAYLNFFLQTNDNSLIEKSITILNSITENDLLIVKKKEYFLLKFVEALIKVYKVNNSSGFYERAIKYIEITKKIIEKDINKPLNFLLLATYFSKLGNIGYAYQLSYELTGDEEIMASAKRFYSKALEITKLKEFRKYTRIITERIRQLDSGLLYQ